MYFLMVYTTTSLIYLIYAIHDSVAIEFLKSLSDRHKEVLDKIQKH